MRVLYYISKALKKIQLPAITSSEVHRTVKICSRSHVVRSSIGKYSYIGSDCSVVNTRIGSFCSIADNVVIGGGHHPIDWVSSSPVFYSGANVLKKNFATHDFSPNKETVIGNDVWLGRNSLIKSGVTIGHGSVVGMGAVLTKSIGEYEVWAGNPAKFIRKRFSDEISRQLLAIRWWEWGDDEIAEKSWMFNDVRYFVEAEKGV
ncbi:CatB-related O-acetyltransferase [Halomonas koreensis]|uniref:CatB-related O-acetyltransferase n=1 Tax=Halomonas koreensis TaxID=245385 RepID=A0ABU1FZ41_9GAMM|nr:CatB-related O-acetyltransferase [Halomonas koreensis]MDR5865945.1 CatB-related O-acetyltransferase [Halomonas koreensis]